MFISKNVPAILVAHKEVVQNTKSYRRTRHSSRLNLKLSENSNKKQLPNMSSYTMEKAMTKEIQFSKAMTDSEILFGKEQNTLNRYGTMCTMINM